MSSHFSHHLETFLEMMSAEKGAALNTLEAYRRDLLDFLSHIKDHEGSQITREDIQSYLADLTDRGYKATTRARRLSSLRQFFRFLLSENVIEKDPTSIIDSPKKGRPLPKILHEEEVQALLTATAELPGAEGLRLICMLELLYATGMRVSELVSLPLSAALSARNPQAPAILLIKGKGGKERIVPISAPSVQALDAYLKVREEFTAVPSKWLFPSRGDSGYLTRQRFAQLLKELALKAGLNPQRVSPHVLRHAFASHLLHHGADLLSVQKLLGHADISTTEIYTHVMTNRLEDLVLSHHPLSEKAKELRKAEETF